MGVFIGADQAAGPVEGLAGRCDGSCIVGVGDDGAVNIVARQTAGIVFAAGPGGCDAALVEAVDQEAQIAAGQAAGVIAEFFCRVIAGPVASGCDRVLIGAGCHSCRLVVPACDAAGRIIGVCAEGGDSVAVKAPGDLAVIDTC